MIRDNLNLVSCDYDRWLWSRCYCSSFGFWSTFVDDVDPLLKLSSAWSFVDVVRWYIDKNSNVDIFNLRRSWSSFHGFFCTAGGLNAEMGEGLQEIQDRTGLKRWQVIFGILGEFFCLLWPFQKGKTCLHLCIYVSLCEHTGVLKAWIT